MIHQRRLLFLFCLLAVFGTAMEAPHYLRWEGVEGESTDDAHANWIPVQSYFNGISVSKGIPPPPPDFSELNLTKKTDNASARMMSALATGEVIAELELDVTRLTTRGETTYLKYKLHNVMISSYSTNGNAEGDPPEEDFSLNYTYIESTYWELDTDGIVLYQARSWWDIPTNTGEASGGNEPPTLDLIPDVSTGTASPIDVLIVINEVETPPDQLEITVETDRPEMILDLAISGTGLRRTLTARTSALYSGVASITVRVSDGVNRTSRSFAVMIDVEMTPFEAFMAANFSREELLDPAFASPIGDPDKDNIPTIVEFTLVTNPNEFTLPQEAVRVTRMNTPEGPVIRLNFRRRTDDPNIGPIPWMAPESLLFEPLSTSNPIYEENANKGENPLYEDVEGIIQVEPDGADVHFIRMGVDVD
ncbi:MAG: Hcp family type VI secretion system effector [Puniceicoccaceae bacterium]